MAGPTRAYLANENMVYKIWTQLFQEALDSDFSAEFERLRLGGVAPDGEDSPEESVDEAPPSAPLLALADETAKSKGAAAEELPELAAAAAAAMTAATEVKGGAPPLVLLAEPKEAPRVRE